MTQEIFTFKRIVLLITTTVFSFSSATTAFFTMGLKSLIWLAVAGVFYFAPFAIISSEFTSAYPQSRGSLYDWLADNLSPKIAFITTFVWYSSYFVWLTSLFLKLWIPFSLLIFGKDMSQMPDILGLPTKLVLTSLAILGIIILNFFINQGFLKIAKLMYLAGLLTLGLLFLTLGANVFLAFCHPQAIWLNIKVASNSKTFFESANLTGLLSQLPFMIFAVTAFGGLDTVSNLVEKVGNQAHKFSKALLVSGGLVLIFYFFNILFWSMGTNFGTLHTSSQTHLGNLMYDLVAHLSGEISSQPLLRELSVRYTALTLFTAYLALLATIGYAPLKVLLHAGDSLRFPSALYETNQNGIHFKAVRLQGLIIGCFIILLSVGLPLVTSLYNHLTLMTNLSRSLPYLVVAMAYPFFKTKFSGNYLKLIKPKLIVNCLAVSVITTLFSAISFEIYSSIQSSGVLAPLFLIIGPLLFAILANYLYERKTNESNPLRRSR
jgi:amino acid transporter